MNIYLIAHGERQHDLEQVDSLGLSQKGIQQADLLGKRLVKYDIDRIYSSDTTCAMQTSNVLNRHLLKEIMTSHDLREIDMGSFPRGWEFLNEFYPDFAMKYAAHTEDIPYPGGENGQDVFLRSYKIISEILETKCNDVAVVTHGGTIGVLLCGILGLSQAQRYLIGSPIEDGSISTIAYENKSGRFFLHTLNDHAHLEF